MSRGPGRVQQTILELIASDPQGAWTVAQICERLYPGARVEKKHRVSVTRALRLMNLPGTWGVAQLSKRGAEYCLYDRCDDESTIRRSYLGIDNRPSSMGFAGWRQNDDRSSFWIEHAHKSALEARRYRDASPIGRLDIEIAESRRWGDHLTMLGASPDAKAGNRQKIAELIEQKAELERATAHDAEAMANQKRSTTGCA